MLTDSATDLDRRIRENQERLAANLKQRYDFIVCGAGSSGSVIARRLAEDPAVTVLLLEAGGSDDIPSVTEPDLWPTNLGGVTDWAFPAEPNEHLNGRQLVLSMGKVLGGGSSINVMAWVRGHKADWDFFAAESGNDAWSYESVSEVYRRVEDWHGATMDERRGSGGPVYLEPKCHPHPAAAAVLEAAKYLGVATFDSPNGELMERPGGVAIMDLIVRGGRRQSVFRSYTYPYLDRPNLTVLPRAIVRRVVIRGNRAAGVEVRYRDEVRQFDADVEVVLCLGAIHTPKALMLSGIGDHNQLRPLGITVEQHLPGVGRNFHDHLGFTCVWQAPDDQPLHGTGDIMLFWPNGNDGERPDFFACQGALLLASPENIARYGLPDTGWIFHGALSHPKSRGMVQLTGPDPDQPVRVTHNGMSHPDDLALAVQCVDGMRRVGNSAPLRPFAKREVMPGDLTGESLVHYLRDAALSFWHHVGTAKMGRDPLAVVDGSLKVYGIENLRVADGSVMPRITSGNTMAPCVVIGERAADEIKSEYGLTSRPVST
ncbi:choline dehydrogenase [Mycobacterium kubicae]|uniref:Choline dehydrogenase n=1 Tax=Mycobacterium kubicae TaxID=120959 RepID=A0AAX1JFM4_9MYCO|nr:GMC family oxidoreductase [Mycobacterium kubicae]MCV7096435.1 GMC family oxidoreductase [Mycobacterium kubicae]ORW05238.1 oxidoreductase [Mycobacterium kubicae]QNI10948.1 GMC family oxidoreductase [Mycobacterium kubicae]QPI39158.1 GMC family oxidoreductase [Mycobacterium kubicae]GFG62933.1 choline dehydrogenase [Mycobacterium kubicae]